MEKAELWGLGLVCWRKKQAGLQLLKWCSVLEEGFGTLEDLFSAIDGLATELAGAGVELGLGFVEGFLVGDPFLGLVVLAVFAVLVEHVVVCDLGDGHLDLRLGCTFRDDEVAEVGVVPVEELFLEGHDFLNVGYDGVVLFGDDACAEVLAAIGYELLDVGLDAGVDVSLCLVGDGEGVGEGDDAVDFGNGSCEVLGIVSLLCHCHKR